MTIFIRTQFVVCLGVNLPGEWETVISAFIFDIPEMKKATNVFATTDLKIELKKTHVTSAPLCLIEHILSFPLCQKQMFYC